MKYAPTHIDRRFIVAMALIAGCSAPANNDLDSADASENLDAGVLPDPLPVPFDAYATESARLLCQTAERCGTMYFVAFLVQEQVTDCTAQMAQFLENNLVAQLQASIVAGRIAYDGERARACIDGSPDIVCGADIETEDCRDTFQGLVPDGGACMITEECGHTSECVGADGCDTPGTCVHVPQRGETCTFQCASDSFCDDSDVCAARRAAEESCSSDSECEPQLACVEGSCVLRSRPGEGEPCEASCDANLVCDTVCRAPRTDGTCTNALDCPEGQLCKEDDTCGPYPTAGQACRYACARGARCLEGMCYAIIETGDACRYHGECATTHCLSGTCAPPFVCE